MEKREREKKIRRGGRNSIEKFSLVLPGGHRRQRREIVFRMRWLQLGATSNVGRQHSPGSEDSR